MAKQQGTPTTNEIKQAKLKQQIFISVAIAAVVVSVSLVFLKFLFDLWTYNARVQSAQREAKSSLEENIEVYADLQDWYTVLESAEGDVEDPDPEVVIDALPDRYDFPALASSLKKMADGSDVELIEFSGVDEEASVPGPSHQPEPYLTDFGVEVSGSYDEISQFINTLDMSIRPFEVTAMNLYGSDDALRAELSLTTYFQPGKNLNYPERSIQ